MREPGRRELGLGSPSDREGKLSLIQTSTDLIGSVQGKLDGIHANFRELGLSDHVAELDTNGLTVIPRSKMEVGDLPERALARCLQLIEERTSVRADPADGSTHLNVPGPCVFKVMHDGREFEELLMHPAVVAFVTYLLGESCAISTSTVFVKGAGEIEIGLHTDNQDHPAPFHAYPVVCNATWTFTDYSREAGGLFYVPGSHKLCRHPLGDEGVDQRVPIVTPAGSLIAWHGNTWHGSFARKIPGLRVSLAMGLTRMHVRRREIYENQVSQEMLDRNPPRYRKLMGLHIQPPYDTDGPDFERIAKNKILSTYD